MRRPRVAKCESVRDPAAPRAAGLRREQRRLRRVLTAIVVSLGPAALVQACGQSSPPGSTMDQPDAGADTGAGADADAAAAADADAAADAGIDAPEDAPHDAPLDVCAATLQLVDGAADASADAPEDADPLCLYEMPCGLPFGLHAIGCGLFFGDASQHCTLVENAGCVADAYAPPADGILQMTCDPCPGTGRRPRGLRPMRKAAAPTAVSAYFARMAHDEAASVHAFRRMHEELAAHGAPLSLQAAAARSARDEERHARVMARRARSLGACVSEPRVRRGRARALEAIAVENAVEGCVNETFGALVIAWQAAHAPSASLRRTFARIAADESRHAALSWEVARWAEGRLDPAGRARVAAARSRAVRRLRMAAPVDAVDAGGASDRAVGRPAPAMHAALVEGMIEKLGLLAPA